MMKESDKHYEYLRAYIAELAMLEFIKDNNLINDIEYKKIKNKIENEYAKYNKLNNSNYGFA
ncbi:unknown [Clostridium sp. CAG:914]|nr:unknown [Clostridium sp. CAG:914]